jgi:uncharacterized protein (TIGR03086 family)
MDVDLPTLHRKALEDTGRLVSAVRDDQLGDATPCEGWDVRELLNHLVYGNRWVAPLVEGRSIDDVGDALEGDLLGDDHVTAYQLSASDADSAFSATGAMDASVAVSYGPIPGEAYCGHRLLDVLVHGWDLAKATGQSTALDPVLVDVCWERLQPELAAWQASGAFGTAQPVADGADGQARLLAALGRHD